MKISAQLAAHLALLTTLALGLSACGSNKGSKAFDEFFGDYSVVATDEDSTNSLCPYTDATIRRGEYEGHEAVLLEAIGKSGSSGNECSAEMTTLLTVDGLEGVSCEGSAGRSRCTKDSDVWDVSIAREGALVRIRTAMSGSRSSEHTWLLRRK